MRLFSQGYCGTNLIIRELPYDNQYPAKDRITLLIAQLIRLRVSSV